MIQEMGEEFNELILRRLHKELEQQRFSDVGPMNSKLIQDSLPIHNWLLQSPVRYETSIMHCVKATKKEQ